ncbi:MAG: hypothetical protein QOH79_1098, partial [Acidimicrobiaceae bacterium]
MTDAADDGSAALHELLTTVNQTWEQMLERSPSTIRRVRIAEKDLEIVLVGEELTSILLPGLEWHRDAIGRPSVTVGAWDAEATAVPLPAPLVARDPLVKRWTATHQGRLMAGADWSDPGMFRLGDRYADRHLLGVSSPVVLHRWESGAPLRRQLWWALGPEVLFAHAAAVGSTEGAALIMGASGSGKSTTSLACLGAGMGFISDDYCLVRDDPPVVHLLAPTARVHAHELALLGDLSDSAVTQRQRDGAPTEKALLYLHRVVPERLVQSAPVRVVLLPEFAEERSPRLVRVSAADALRAVAPAALWQMHVEPGRELQGL